MRVLGELKSRTGGMCVRSERQSFDTQSLSTLQIHVHPNCCAHQSHLARYPQFAQSPFQPYCCDIFKFGPHLVSQLTNPPHRTVRVSCCLSTPTHSGTSSRSQRELQPQSTIFDAGRHMGLVESFATRHRGFVGLTPAESHPSPIVPFGIETETRG